jgi:hypothetical protein
MAELFATHNTASGKRGRPSRFSADAARQQPKRAPTGMRLRRAGATRPGTHADRGAHLTNRNTACPVRP